MNNIARRIIAGVSAAALFVSAVGSDAFMGIFGWEIYAVSADDRGKIGKSTGFPNLEQDTIGNNYNTGYGLHTNKTVTAVGADGRTFDLDLESWYVGENPVDVATILDASGSMAWTVDTLEPLKIYDKAVNASADELMKKYEITEADLKKYDEDTRYENANKETKVLAAIQDKNGGYLPQDVVDLILDKTKTDNSKLSYSDYLYYIYESRSSVSEFVPLGYWDGGESTTKFEPIGYYKFDGSLKNEITDDYASYIKQATAGGTFDASEKVKITPQAVFSGGYLDLSETDKNGNLVIDLSDRLNVEEDITISFDLNCEKLDSAVTPQSPIIYLGDGGNKNYLALMRGRCHEAGSGAENHLYIFDSDNKLTPIDGDKNADNKALNGNYSPHCTVTISKKSIDSYNVKLVVGTKTFNYETNNVSLNNSKLYLVIGGDEILSKGDLKYKNDASKSIDPTNLKGNKIKNLQITGTNTENTGFSENFTLINAEGLKSAKGLEAKYCQQKSIGSTDISLEEQITVDADAKYDDNALNLTQTAKAGAVLLDKAPTGSSFTLSFAVKKASNDSSPDATANLLYIGSMDTTNDYYQIMRREGSSGNRLVMREKGKEKNHVNINDVFSDKTDYSVITIVVDGTTITQYKDGAVYNASSSINLDNELKDFSLILGGLFNSSYNGADIYIDDLYVFDKALKPSEVALVAKDQLMVVPSALTDGCKGFHAVTRDNESVAQISTSLAQNPNDDERAGWYYVNSHSTWADISGCLEGGKQYLGVLNDTYLAKIPSSPSVLGDNDSKHEIDSKVVLNDIKDNNKSIANIPSVYQAACDKFEEAKNIVPGAKPDLVLGEQYKYYVDYEKLIEGNDTVKTFTPAETERSLQFYIDKAGYLRCFYCTGEISWKRSGNTWNYDQRTFCSVVYQKTPYNVETKEGNATKYEQLNEALNQFYAALAENSDLTNSAIVRFSTNKVVDAGDDDLKMLIMKDWTNWSEYYTNYKNDKGEAPEKNTYMKNLLIADSKKSSTDTTESAAQKIKEYPYVMTGGTYTWTGLKAFYDNMVKVGTGTGSGNRVYDIANDARDKYLIIFTDGRDNTVGTDDKKYVHVQVAGDKDYKNSIGNFAPTDENGKQIELTNDSQLAEAWANKLKQEGYTIYCVMMATGSISPTANAEEYDRAFNFLTTLAGSTETDKEIEKVQQQIDELDPGDVEYEGNKKKLEEEIETIKAANVIVADPTSKGNTTVEAFQQILEQIQQPRQDYTVQDYIDPRFDLIDKNDNIYHLGAGGKITVTDKDGKDVTTGLTLSDGSEFKNGSAVGNIIDNIGNTDIVGLAYTPQDSYMVNREPTKDDDGKITGYTTGDDGTGYLYYDDEKDMYYLRWTDQIIPMENESFDTTDPPNKKLDVWSATIRLKAKDDFIGGNNILTNGNEAGENLVYSDATIENMDKGDNYLLYGFEEEDKKDGKIPYRKKLEALSGTNRKINAVDADGVSQAVYGNGIDIPSSGFPRTTVNVRLLKLDANNLNDVIYMGEVVSPTMMLADLENGYMTGSYYLQYLERYAYRVYGEAADAMPLIELLNKWLKIDDEKQASKTFTIPYIYLPDPEYGEDGKLARDGDKVKIQNSTGASWDGSNIDFDDLNLRDVTGFITYTWKRDDDSHEEQQNMGTLDSEGNPQYDITIDYVVKNTNQIKYNLQLTFTPLKEDDLLTGFTLNENFIESDSTGEGGDKFFNIDSSTFEFSEIGVSGWSIDTRSDYLKAMVKEEKTYEPHVMYDSRVGYEKWVLVDESSTDDFTPTDAVNAYTADDQTVSAGDNKVTDSGVYDLDNVYKPADGNVQLEGSNSGDVKNISGYYTDTPEAVNLLNASGEPITDENGNLTGDAPCSLAANTTYTKDVVNAALALELFVDGKYLQGASPEIKEGKTYTFIATRYYDDPYDPLPFDETKAKIYADTGDVGSDGKVEGKKYQLTFTVDKTSLPDDPQENVIYKVWAHLSEVKVAKAAESDYEKITETVEVSSNPYCGYEKIDALPIGTYVIDTVDNNITSVDQFKIADADTTGTKDLYFQYLKIDNDDRSYTYDKFPANVYQVSPYAATDTGDGDYLIKNDTTDNSKVNIAENNRTKDATTNTQTITFYFGTVESREINGKELSNTKGASGIVDKANDYAKDRLGIITLSADNNSLTITKEVTNTENSADKNHDWSFTITIKTNDSEWIGKHKLVDDGLEYTLYKSDGSDESKTATVTSAEASGTYTLTIKIQLQHNQKAVFKDLPEGTWQVQEEPSVFCTPHNDQSDYGENEWRYNKADATRANIELDPASQVNYVNEFPYNLPSAGGIGTNILIYSGITFMLLSGLSFAILYKRGRSRDKPKG